MDNKSNYSLKVAALPSNDYAFKNQLFLNTKDFNGIKLVNKGTTDDIFIKIRETIFQVKDLTSVSPGKFYFIN